MCVYFWRPFDFYKILINTYIVKFNTRILETADQYFNGFNIFFWYIIFKCSQIKKIILVEDTKILIWKNNIDNFILLTLKKSSHFVLNCHCKQIYKMALYWKIILLIQATYVSFNNLINFYLSKINLIINPTFITLRCFIILALL